MTRQKPLIAAGVAALAKDTGRVLMLQRGLEEDDAAAGTWEFPGGCLEDGENAFVAAVREWQEETGNYLPKGHVFNGWDASNGVYCGYVYVIPRESDVDIHGDGRGNVTNPDDPDGDMVEALAWWSPHHMRANPAVRRELEADIERVIAALKRAAREAKVQPHEAVTIGSRVYGDVQQHLVPASHGVSRPLPVTDVSPGFDLQQHLLRMGVPQADGHVSEGEVWQAIIALMRFLLPYIERFDQMAPEDISAYGVPEVSPAWAPQVEALIDEMEKARSRPGADAATYLRPAARRLAESISNRRPWITGLAQTPRYRAMRALQALLSAIDVQVRAGSYGSEQEDRNALFRLRAGVTRDAYDLAASLPCQGAEGAECRAQGWQMLARVYAGSRPFKGTLQGRVPGKRIGSKTWVHRDYAPDVFPPDELRRAERVMQKGYPDHSHMVVRHDGSNGSFAFIDSPDFDTADEPVVGDSVIVHADGRTTFTPAAADPLIWHHKHLFVADGYEGFDQRVSRERSQVWAPHVRPDERRRMGRQSVWNQMRPRWDGTVGAPLDPEWSPPEGEEGLIRIQTGPAVPSTSVPLRERPEMLRYVAERARYGDPAALHEGIPRPVPTRLSTPDTIAGLARRIAALPSSRAKVLAGSIAAKMVFPFYTDVYGGDVDFRRARTVWPPGIVERFRSFFTAQYNADVTDSDIGGWLAAPAACLHLLRFGRDGVVSLREWVTPLSRLVDLVWQAAGWSLGGQLRWDGPLSCREPASDEEEAAQVAARALSSLYFAVHGLLRSYAPRPGMLGDNTLLSPRGSPNQLITGAVLYAGEAYSCAANPSRISQARFAFARFIAKWQQALLRALPFREGFGVDLEEPQTVGMPQTPEVEYPEVRSALEPHPHRVAPAPRMWPAAGTDDAPLGFKVYAPKAVSWEVLRYDSFAEALAFMLGFHHWQEGTSDAEAAVDPKHRIHYEDGELMAMQAQAGDLPALFDPVGVLLLQLPAAARDYIFARWGLSRPGRTPAWYAYSTNERADLGASLAWRVGHALERTEASPDEARRARRLRVEDTPGWQLYAYVDYFYPGLGERIAQHLRAGLATRTPDLLEPSWDGE